MLKLAVGDITNLENVDVIVNCAKKSLLGGMGVDFHIHSKGGNKLTEECRRLGGCEVGEAKMTRGYDLGIPYVIHAVGVIYRDKTWAKNNNYDQERLLANAYINSLKLAKENGLKRIGIPAISTGAYGYPIDEATEIALDVVLDFMEENDDFEISLVVYTEEVYNEYVKQLKERKVEYTVEVIKEKPEMELSFENLRRLYGRE